MLSSNATVINNIKIAQFDARILTNLDESCFEPEASINQIKSHPQNVAFTWQVL